VEELDARQCLAAFKQEYDDKLREIATRGTFLDDEEVSRLLDLSLPGLDELMAFLEVCAWVERGAYDSIVVDTAPSGHTLRMLAMPEFIGKWLAMLETLLAKHRYMKWVFSHSSDRDELDAFLNRLTGSVNRMEELLRDAARCRFVPVMLAEAMSIRETSLIVEEVNGLKMVITDIVVNRLYPANSCALCRDERLRQVGELRKLSRNARLSRFALWGIPIFPEEVRGEKPLELFWHQVMPIAQDPPEVSRPRNAPAIRVEGPEKEPPREAALLIFAGKGGVGKTTLACAAAVQLAKINPRRNVLLVSTGPAHSLSTCLEMPINSRPKAVAPGLGAMEIDAEAEFAALKKQYAGDVEQFFKAVSSNFDLSFDREVLERILDLCPPGLDEVMALTRVMALLASGSCDLLVLDSAATGHLIRLLELPELLDQWLKVLFDFFLKYRQVFRLTRFSQELVTMSKNLKKLHGLLNHPHRTALYAVSIPTDMAFEETLDLVTACEHLGISVAGLFLNLVTPLRDCGLCSALNRRESLVRERFKRYFSTRDVTQVFRGGEVRGLRALEELGGRLWQGARVESMAYVA
jgi:arsenite-transporting ATPase